LRWRQSRRRRRLILLANPLALNCPVEELLLLLIVEFVNVICTRDNRLGIAFIKYIARAQLIVSHPLIIAKAYLKIGSAASLAIFKG